MAGSSPRTPSPLATPQAPLVRALQCPKCAGRLEVRGLGQTTTIACGSCGSVVDISSDDLRVISTFNATLTRHPVIPLGTRGTLRGDPYEVIGFMCRAITVDGTDYEWSEYLLFNPYKGFRWLTEYNGHWNDVKTTTGQPEDDGDKTVRYLGSAFRRFQSADARVTYVLGEFYWRVSVGERARVSDYVMPPLMLSKEETGEETTWSLGEYVEPDAVAKAFGVTTSMPSRIGVYANQPSPLSAKATVLGKAFACLVAAAVIVQMASCALAQNRKVFEQSYTFTQEERGKALVTEPFELTGHRSNVMVETTADLSNKWIYLSMALINLDSGQAYDFGREVSYYSGVEGGESWSEGGRSDRAILPSVRAGQYYLRIEPESDAPPINYAVKVVRDVPRLWFLPVALVALSIYPLLFWIRSRSFETQRWAESDDAPVSSGGSDDSE
ncbi:MAG: DUF4178 domain-containing protein [Acidobacteria bacterium]|nr:DUF4178 domain-containing protein [Acidobacteriota bacterium]